MPSSKRSSKGDTQERDLLQDTALIPERHSHGLLNKVPDDIDSSEGERLVHVSMAITRGLYRLVWRTA